MRQKRQETGLGGFAGGKLEQFPNHVLPVARRSVRRSDILVPAETVAPLVLLPVSLVGFQGVAVAAAAAKNVVLWEEVEIGEVAQEEGNKIVVGMVVAEVVRECMSEVAVGPDEYILAAVMKGDTGDEAELDEGVVGVGIAG